jgi:hypothetical protein
MRAPERNEFRLAIHPPELIAEYLQLLATKHERIPGSLLGCYHA